MGLILSYPPGFADLSDSALAAGEPALGVQVAKIYENSAFSVARTEVFVDTYVNGDTVPLPVSPIDGYTYSESECFFMWGIRATTDQQSGWINGGSLFYTAYKVDQLTGFDVSGNPTTFGKVYVDEWYCNPPPNTDLKHTNDGQLIVYTIAQRGNGSILVASSPSYSGISGGSVAQDAPLTQLLAQSLNDDAKFACLDHEVFYLGEFYNGQTVPMPVSPADGYHYSAAECKFMHSWRWTAFGATNPIVQPPQSIGQLSYQQATVSNTGVVTCAVWFVDLSGNLFQYFTYGRIAVFAFCQRSGTPGSISPAAVNFAEVPIADFMPGQDLPEGTVSQIIKNTQQGMLTPEFFGPTDYADGSTIALPTSPIDGYAYSRYECFYLWEWSSTQNDAGSHARVPLFWALVNQATGAVQLQTWRLPPGGPYVDSNNSLCRIRVLTVARRLNQPVSSTIPSAGVNPSSDGTTTANPDAGAYVTVEQNGTPVAQEKILNFLPPMTATDDPTNASTDIATSVMIGDVSSPSVGGKSGLVPAPPVGSAAAGDFLRADGTWAVPTDNSPNTGVTSSVGITVDGGGSVPSTGINGFIQVPYAATIVGWTIIADQSGSCSFTVKKSTFAAFPTTVSIVASAPPNLASQQNATSGALTGWTTTINAGDVIEFDLSSVTTCQRITLELKLVRS
jgi:hypothetical protein